MLTTCLTWPWGWLGTGRTAVKWTVAVSRVLKTIHSHLEKPSFNLKVHCPIIPSVNVFLFSTGKSVQNSSPGWRELYCRLRSHQVSTSENWKKQSNARIYTEKTERYTNKQKKLKSCQTKKLTKWTKRQMYNMQNLQALASQCSYCTAIGLL